MPNQFTSLLPTEERFWSHVDKTEGCWRWTAAHGTTGYGLFKVGGRMVRAHRFIYERNVGPIPNNRILDHICRTRDCVRFSHLRLATVRDNTLWGESFAAVNAKKTHCPAGHPYDEANTLFGGRRRERICRTCNRLRCREDRRKRKAANAAN